jgi:hypothetical protein
VILVLWAAGMSLSLSFFQPTLTLDFQNQLLMSFLALVEVSAVCLVLQTAGMSLSLTFILDFQNQLLMSFPCSSEDGCC